MRLSQYAYHQVDIFTASRLVMLLPAFVLPGAMMLIITSIHFVQAPSRHRNRFDCIGKKRTDILYINN
jgi:hypothetical protein